MGEIGKVSAKIAFEKLSKYERITENQNPVNGIFAWSWITSIDNDLYQDLAFIIEIPETFPLVWPSFRMDENTFLRIGWIPHIDSLHYLCLFDNNTFPDYQDPPETVVLKAMQQAKKTVNAGLKCNSKEYQEEFLSYWQLPYNDKDFRLKIIHWGNFAISKNSIIDIAFVKNKIADSNHLIIEKKCHHEFSNYLSSIGNTIICNFSAFYIGELNIFDEPPFLLDNKSIYHILKSNPQFCTDEFQNYFSNTSYPMILFSKRIDDHLHLLGWRHKTKFESKIDGFRQNMSQRFFQLSATQKNDAVQRIEIENVSLRRLQMRSTGMDQEEIPALLLFGIGSIGSNLVHFLNGYNPFWTFVDKDKLEVENLGRHLLGLEYTEKPKSDAMKEFQVRKNPLIDVISYNCDVGEFVTHEISSINKNDFIFSCLGVFNIEAYVGDLIYEGKISVPTFFIWVEPHLVGGHCLFLPPKTNKFSNFFDEEQLYKFNVIRPEDYSNNEKTMFLKDSGCQSIYVPYGQRDITLFLSGLFPFVDKIILNGEHSCRAFTWVGNLELLNEKDITPSTLYYGKHKGQIIEHTL